LSISADNQLGNSTGGLTLWRRCPGYHCKLHHCSQHRFEQRRRECHQCRHGTKFIANSTMVGAGNLAVTGLGTLVLSGSVNYSGTTIISSGTLLPTRPTAAAATTPSPIPSPPRQPSEAMGRRTLASGKTFSFTGASSSINAIVSLVILPWATEREPSLSAPPRRHGRHLGANSILAIGVNGAATNTGRSAQRHRHHESGGSIERHARRASPATFSAAPASRVNSSGTLSGNFTNVGFGNRPSA